MNDFNELVVSLLIEIKKKGASDIDYWLDAASVALGATMVVRLFPRLGLEAPVETRALVTPQVPIISSLSEGAAYLLAKSLAKAKTSRGRRIRKNLELAKMLYGEYLDRFERGVDDPEKKVLVDQLYRSLLSEIDVVD